MKKLVITLLFLLATPLGFAQAPAQKKNAQVLTKRAAIIALLDESPFSKKVQKNLEYMANQFYPVNDERVIALVSEYNQALTKELRQAMIKLYDEKFTAKEIQALLNWSRTPVARKSLDLIPVITDAMSPLVQKYSKELIARLETLKTKKNGRVYQAKAVAKHVVARNIVKKKSNVKR